VSELPAFQLSRAERLDLWQQYLDQQSNPHVRRVWDWICSWYTDPPLPTCWPMEDSGGTALSWNPPGEKCLTFEVTPDGTYEWFYSSGVPSSLDTEGGAGDLQDGFPVRFEDCFCLTYPPRAS
jgi:hypothetical protein